MINNNKMLNIKTMSYIFLASKLIISVAEI